VPRDRWSTEEHDVQLDKIYSTGSLHSRAPLTVLWNNNLTSFYTIHTPSKIPSPQVQKPFCLQKYPLTKNQNTLEVLSSVRKFTSYVTSTLHTHTKTSQFQFYSSVEQVYIAKETPEIPQNLRGPKNKLYFQRKIYFTLTD
jgi:hypothetical protein